MKKEFIKPSMAVQRFARESVLTASGGDNPTPQQSNTELMEQALSSRGIEYKSINITEY